LDKFIAEGRKVLKTYNQQGNADTQDLWITEAYNFLKVNMPEFAKKLEPIGSKYRDQLLKEGYGRTAYNLIQEQLEVLKLARGYMFALNSAVSVKQERQESIADALEMKPGMFGFSLNLKILFKWLWQFFHRRGDKPLT